MRILRVRVPEFGPLRALELEPSGELTVVWGPNEAGKTTLLDFLVGQLFRWERRTGTRLETVLPGVDRFGDPSDADGRIDVRLGGDILEYPGSPSLLHLLDLDHAALAGLFCVRSGELDLPGPDRGEFWAELKKLLAGLPRGVDTLREAVHREARLTPGGEPSDRGSPGPRTRHRKLLDRIERLEELEARLDEAAAAEARIARLDERQEELDRARRARIAALAGERETLRTRLSGLPDLPRQALREWRELESERDGELVRRRERARKAAEEAEAEAERREAEKQAASGEGSSLRGKLAEASEADLGRRAARLAAEPEKAAREPSPTSTRVYQVLVGLLLVLLAVALFLPSHLLTPIALPFLVGFVALAIVVIVWRRRRKKGEAARERRADRVRALLDDAGDAGLEVTEVGEIPGRLQGLEVEAARRESEARAAAERAEDARERAAGSRHEAEEAAARRRAIDERIAELGEELGSASLEEAESRDEARRELTGRLEGVERSLAELAGPDPESWEAQPPADTEEAPEWDPAERAGVERELARARAAYRELRDAFVQAGLQTPEDVLTELRSARREVRDLELDWRAGKLAGRIFATMDEVLERRLAEALDRSGPLSPGSLLERITGRYRSLSRDEEGGLVLEDREGRALPVGAVSRGTRDQVHLVLRAGLARSALEAAGIDEPGFLLLDDAFLTADWARRERLVAAAADLAEAGWQVLYLTCDDHLRDLFVDAGAALHEL